MRRPIARLPALAAALFALAAAAMLLPASPASAQACEPFAPGNLRAPIEAAAVIVVADLGEGTDGDTVVVRPRTYLKGAAESRSFVLTRPDDGTTPEGACAPADLPSEGRVLLLLDDEGGRLQWPEVSHAFVFEGGEAANQADPPWVLAESELIDTITDLTGQEAVPAGEGDDPPHIDWTGTVLPLTAALVVVFAIGLVLMRIWHRIDPT